MPHQSSCIWHVTPSLLDAIDAELGPPVDSYINGSHTWFSDETEDVTLEWRLHPVAAFAACKGITVHDRWDAVLEGLHGAQRAANEEDASPDGTQPGDMVQQLDSTTPLAVGEERRSLASLWDVLECFVAFGDDYEPATLREIAAARVGAAPDAFGIVDHDAIGDAWERNAGALSIGGALAQQLHTPLQ